MSIQEPRAAVRAEAVGERQAAPPNGRGAQGATSGRRRVTSILARGEPFVWLTGGGLALALLMIGSLLALVLLQGFWTFWPRPVALVTLRDGQRLLGEVTRSESFRPSAEQLQSLPAAEVEAIEARGGTDGRNLYRIANYDVYGEDFRWVPDAAVESVEYPRDAWLLERLEWGPWIGWIDAVRVDGQPLIEAAQMGAVLPDLVSQAHDRRSRLVRMEKEELGGVNRALEELRVQAKSLEAQPAAPPGEGGHLEAKRKVLADAYSGLQKRIADLRAEDGRTTIVLREIGGQTKELRVSELVRAVPANQLGLTGKVRIYLSRWAEFLTEDPREANTEGGVFPAIFGTFMMTVIMSLMVAPFGVITALYLREYARQGALVSGVRIAVNNLAGVPSIVFGVFGLGFLCYTLGGTIDSIFFSERLPRPTFGTGGLLWASLTLALLTVPVVIVATEEALSAVPRSLREGSYACGASRWQTIHRVVLPRAAGGIMTGLILAMARGAGEVAPLMLTGVVKLAPELPLDGTFPYLHLERSFMHLGFHIYDVGFQSRNAEAARPMVFTTTLLLILLILVLNLTAIRLRTRLRQRFASSKF
jgi:phosphate transport system permease protein